MCTVPESMLRRGRANCGVKEHMELSREQKKKKKDSQRNLKSKEMKRLMRVHVKGSKGRMKDILHFITERSGSHNKKGTHIRYKCMIILDSFFWFNMSLISSRSGISNRTIPMTRDVCTMAYQAH